MMLVAVLVGALASLSTALRPHGGPSHSASGRQSLRQRSNLHRRHSLLIPLATTTTTTSEKTGAAKESPTLTQRVLERLEREDDGGGAGRSGSYAGLRGLDRAWRAMRDGDGRGAPKDFVRVVNEDDANAESAEKLTPTFDVVVLGGTLGIFVAAALQRRGLKTAVAERGAIVGRNQEWNLSLDEVRDLVAAGALDASDVDGAVAEPNAREVLVGAPGTLVASHFGSVRAGFNEREYQAGDAASSLQEIWLPRVLNIGVRPDVAVARAKRNFLAAGGTVLEHAPCRGVVVKEDRAEVLLSSSDSDGPEEESRKLVTRVLVDAMGNGSPIARQARAEANGGVEPRPSGACCVVGTLARGFSSENDFADLIYTNELARADRQYFWEAFPAASIAPDARTTYLFTYLDVDANADHGVEAQFEDYWAMLPDYARRHGALGDYQEAEATVGPKAAVERAVENGDLKVQRALYGLFPTYKDSPLASRWDRILAVGDASGVQSPLSFGGFGALTRHLARVSTALDEAIAADALSKDDLSRINPYMPNLSATWMFQNAFVQFPTRPNDFIYRLMRLNYAIMADLGDDVLRPFNQDVVQPRALARVLAQATLRDPANIPRLLYHIGPAEIADWTRHFAAMFLYDLAHSFLGPKVRDLAAATEDAKLAFRLRRTADAWEFGSGNDYGHGAPPPPPPPPSSGRLSPHQEAHAFDKAAEKV